uniref:Uncharacterized protein n=1 Tax=Pithovirus LCPAC304 TaxID=2506594 RepID=A0A481ZAY1_9VIRU|nr:MAG: hypothetical protein LCPAC304_06770 [Pithovirus LCPAC304]
MASPDFEDFNVGETCSAPHCENTHTMRFPMLSEETDFEDVQTVEYMTYICLEHLVQCGQEVQKDFECEQEEEKEEKAFESWISFLDELGDSVDV